MERNLRFKIDWASPKVGRKFTVFALFYFVFEGKPPGGGGEGLYLEGSLNGGFLRYEFGGLIFGGAYFGNFTACVQKTTAPLPQAKISEHLRFFLRGGVGGGGGLYTGYILDFLTCDEIRILEPGG